MYRTLIDSGKTFVLVPVSEVRVHDTLVFRGELYLVSKILSAKSWKLNGVSDRLSYFYNPDREYFWVLLRRSIKLTPQITYVSNQV